MLKAVEAQENQLCHVWYLVGGTENNPDFLGSGQIYIQYHRIGRNHVFMM
jgi:hypothetical protein